MNFRVHARKDVYILFHQYNSYNFKYIIICIPQILLLVLDARGDKAINGNSYTDDDGSIFSSFSLQFYSINKYITDNDLLEQEWIT